MLDWRDLVIFITAICDVLSLTMNIHEAISTHLDGGQARITSHCRGCMSNQVQSDYILEHHA